MLAIESFMRRFESLRVWPSNIFRNILLKEISIKFGIAVCRKRCEYSVVCLVVVLLNSINGFRVSADIFLYPKRC
jgi:hypothetical protein